VFGRRYSEDNALQRYTIEYAYGVNGIAGFRIHQGNTTTDYFYVKNIMGDVLGIVNSSGTLVAEYRYDAYGKPVKILDGSGNDVSANYAHIANINPIRYRGYYYDIESGFYYLNSRYYDPEIGRFINADGVISGNSGSIQGYNMFAYCFNNPVNMSDADGNWPKWIKKVASSIGGFITKLTKPFEAEIGFGPGIGFDISDTVRAEVSRDINIRIDDHNLILGNVLTSELSLLDSDIRIGNTYYHAVEVNGEKISNSGKASDGPFDIINYPDVTHGYEFAMPFFAINSDGELLLSLSAGFHLGIGGHASIAYNLSELIEVFK